MTHRKQKGGNLPHEPGLLFTYEDVTWLKQALVTLEGVTSRQPPSLPKLPIARETVTELQKKLSRMSEQHAYSYKMPITRNDVVMLHTAVWLFLLDVVQQPDSAEKQKALSHCQALHSQLAPFVGKIA
ncbi:MAG: hypothetical protein JO125_06765 [Chloroflexi bacterium]|nr:hypothetical protein [Ktedonobacteraceae bacterium]MBV9707092.1 hypothetical protein [Chloroflexota bacterium]